MSQSITSARSHFTARSSLAALGLYLGELDLLAPMRRLVQIPQKTVKDSPMDKLTDLLITLLCGAHGIVEINTLLRADPGLQRAFGRQRCSEQSVAQETLNACTSENVEQMQQAFKYIFRQHSASYRHDYEHDWQVLDVDLSGLPSGPTAALATKGFFGSSPTHRGRQLGRVYASGYEEILVDELFTGDTSLVSVLTDLVSKAATLLDLDREQRARTIIRFDAGGGSVSNCNWLLEQGYAFIGKDFSGKRAKLLSYGVEQWYRDPRSPEREVGWITEEASAYVQPVRRIGIRARKANGQWYDATLLIGNLAVDQVPVSQRSGIDLLSQDAQAQDLLRYLRFYDLRGGGVETSFHGDKTGLGLTTRRKKRVPAQQMLVLLGSLVHNLLIWYRRWLSTYAEKVAQYGLQRLVRDVCQMSGKVRVNAHGQVISLSLNPHAPLASVLIKALRSLLAPLHLALNLAQT